MRQREEKNELQTSKKIVGGAGGNILGGTLYVTMSRKTREPKKTRGKKKIR